MTDVNLKKSEIIRSDGAKAEYASNLKFPANFIAEGDRDLAVNLLNLRTSGILLGNNLSIDQVLIGNGVSENTTRGLSGNVAVAYHKITYELLDIPIKDVAKVVYEQHISVVGAIETAYRCNEVLPRKVGRLEFIGH